MFMGPFNMGMESHFPRVRLDTIRAGPLDVEVYLPRMSYEGGPPHWGPQACVPTTFIYLRVGRDPVSVI
jgi:hypothetical protein